MGHFVFVDMPTVKIFLTMLSASILLAATGCVFRGDRADPKPPVEHSSGVDHGEYPGDMEHGDTMQK